MNVVEAAGLLQIWYRSINRADDATIRKAWREAAAMWHPDRGGLTEAMQRINAARDYLLSMPQAARAAERSYLKSRGTEDDIIDVVLAEQEEWEARRPVSNEPSVTNNNSPEQSNQSVTNSKRRAAAWESRNQQKVREQTRERVARHRERNQEEYRAYMREYMRKRREAGRG